MLLKYPCYNADSSAMIGLKDNYPQTVPRFRPIWDLVRALIGEGRFFVCPQVVAECEDKDDVIPDFVAAHPRIVYPSVEFQQHLVQFTSEPLGRQMAERNLNRVRDRADAYVVASALALDGREARNLSLKMVAAAHCFVLQQEKTKGGPLKIPNVCEAYGISCVTWPELLQREDHGG